MRPASVGTIVYRRKSIRRRDVVAVLLGLPVLALLLLPMLSLAARAPARMLGHYLGDDATIQVILMVGSFAGLFIVRALLSRRTEVLRQQAVKGVVQ